MQGLKEALSLKNLPIRIECYDISNIQGSDSVGAMVVFTNGEKDKAQFRKFKIKTVKGADDYASLAEVLKRRFENAGDSFAKRPDLIVIDGGKGQLGTATDALKGMDVDICALAEREEEIFVPGRMQPIILARDSLALRLLINLRNETHRFALCYHRKLRDKNMFK
jgi:excinuclease ABC subunit C